MLIDFYPASACPSTHTAILLYQFCPIYQSNAGLCRYDCTLYDI